jgi:hypothetical protein
MPHSLPDRRPAYIQPAAYLLARKKAGRVFSQELKNLFFHHRDSLLKLSLGKGKEACLVKGQWARVNDLNPHLYP